MEEIGANQVEYRGLRAVLPYNKCISALRSRKRDGDIVIISNENQ